MQSPVKHCVVAAAFAAAMGVLPALSFAQAAQTTWTESLDDDWNKADNWSAGVPASGSVALLENAATARTTADVPSFNQLVLRNGAGALSVNHAMSFSDFRDFVTPSSSVSPGMNLVVGSGGNIHVTGPGESWNQGFGGKSNLTISGGTLTVDNSMVLFGRSMQDLSTLNLSAGTLNVGRGFFGSISFAAQLINPGIGHATVNVSGGMIDFNRLSFGGRPGDLTEIVGFESSGILNLSGGVLKSHGQSPRFDVGNRYSYGAINMSGGHIRMDQGGTMSIGTFQGLAGFNMSGGSIELTDGGQLEFGSVDAVQTGGQIVANGGLRIGYPLRSSARSKATYSISGPDSALTIVRGDPSLPPAPLYIAGGSFSMTNGAKVRADYVDIDFIGTLLGSGRIETSATSVSRGVIDPDLGGFTFTGPLDIFAGKVIIDFTDPLLADGTFDVISNDGDDRLFFGFELDLRFAGGAYPNATVPIFKNWGSFANSFENVVVTGLPDGQSATFNYFQGTVTIADVPEPSAVGLLVGSGILLLRRGRKQRAI